MALCKVDVTSYDPHILERHSLALFLFLSSVVVALLCIIGDVAGADIPPGVLWFCSGVAGVVAGATGIGMMAGCRSSIGRV